ncbi:MAG: hypothetical protein GY724_00355, partial [Actinomycetia bacterium]|nr:hypothetical protein [Actinomycetes bacterium]
MDHVALASRQAWDNMTRYCYQLGGEWLGGPDPGEVDGKNNGFYFSQVGFEDGAKLELLEPIDDDGSEFIRRYLDRNGPGPHHITFKVSDFDHALDAVGAAGYDVVSVNRSDPDWHEAFLHPKQSHGIVIQLAYHRTHDDDGADETNWVNETQLPASLRSRLPVLAEVEHLVADLESATKLFAGPLEMEEHEQGSDSNGQYVVLTDGPWRLKLTRPANQSWQHWLGPRPGRLFQLHFELTEPGTVPGAEPLGAGLYQIAPEHNLGTRLLLSPPSHR